MERVKRVRPETRVREAIAEMDHDGVSQFPVMEDGQILGMLGREDVLSFLRTLQEVGV